MIVVLVAHFPPFARLANSRPQERAFAPCRTVALVLAWSVPPALVAWGLDRSQPVVAYAVAWGLAVLVLGWRVAKVWQRARGDTRQRARAPVTSSYGMAGPGPGGRMADLGRGVRAAEGARGQMTAVGPRDPGLAGAELPSITVDQVMAELIASIPEGEIEMARGSKDQASDAQQGQQGVSMKGRLLRVKFAKVNGVTVNLPQPAQSSETENVAA